MNSKGRQIVQATSPSWQESLDYVTADQERQEAKRARNPRFFDELFEKTLEEAKRCQFAGTMGVAGQYVLPDWTTTTPASETQIGESFRQRDAMTVKPQISPFQTSVADDHQSSRQVQRSELDIKPQMQQSGYVSGEQDPPFTKMEASQSNGSTSAFNTPSNERNRRTSTATHSQHRFHPYPTSLGTSASKGLGTQQPHQASLESSRSSHSRVKVEDDGGNMHTQWSLSQGHANGMRTGTSAQHSTDQQIAQQANLLRARSNSGGLKMETVSDAMSLQKHPSSRLRNRTGDHLGEGQAKRLHGPMNNLVRPPEGSTAAFGVTRASDVSGTSAVSVTMLPAASLLDFRRVSSNQDGTKSIASCCDCEPDSSTRLISWNDVSAGAKKLTENSWVCARHAAKRGTDDVQAKREPE